MSFQRKESPCGRHAEKPKEKQTLEESHLMEEAMPINQQIENLRTKISLKERYNNVLKDELEENRQGATSVIKDLHAETINLRHALLDAVGQEKFAVQNALRTHRMFQLALRGKAPESAIAWLDDKLFENAKTLNGVVDRLISKRQKLRDYEKVVMTFEKWPRPGMSPWDINMQKKTELVEIATSNVAVKLEASRILHTKYLEIKDKLRDEQRHYRPVIQNLDSQLKYQTEELKALQNMLDEAQVFQQDATVNLEETEKEASQNRKKRRLQMAKIKKAVEKFVQENFANPKQEKSSNNPKTSIEAQGKNISRSKLRLSQMELHERLKVKRSEIEKLETWVARVVSTMRVRDLTYIPTRLNTVIEVGKALTTEQNSRETLRNLFVHQRDQLLLILNYLRYTGAREQSHFHKVLEDFDRTLQSTRMEVAQVGTNTDKLGGKLLDIRLGILSVLGRLDDGKSNKRHRIKSSEELMLLLPIVHEKIRKLVMSVKTLKKLFRKKGTDKDFSHGVKRPSIQERLVRVGTPHVSEGSEDEDYDDFKVPTNAEIKAKSGKIVLQESLRRGIAIG